jgi:hypothetical protein
MAMEMPSACLHCGVEGVRRKILLQPPRFQTACTRAVIRHVTLGCTATKWLPTGVNRPGFPEAVHNHRRLLAPIGNVPPAEAEARYHTHVGDQALAA